MMCALSLVSKPHLRPGVKIPYILSRGTSDRGYYSGRFSSARWTEEEIHLLASINRFLLRSSHKRSQKPARSCEGQPQSRNGSIPRAMNEIGADRGRKAAEDSGGKAIGERESRSPNIDWHDLREEND